MNQTIWAQLTSHESLLAIGISLVMAGIILRGFASNARRSLARRKQHRLDDRKSADATLNAELNRPPAWFEQNLGLIANAVLIAGVAITVTAFFRK
jgi:hypothetical protein